MRRVTLGAVLTVLLSGLASAASLFDEALQAEKEARYGEAISKLETWTKDHPDDSDSLNRLAKLYAWTKRYAQAQDLYERALRIQPGSVDALVGLGYVEAWQGRYDPARRRFRAALEKDPGNLDALKGLEQLDAWERPQTLESRAGPGGASPKVETGFLYEHYSLPTEGGVWWANAAVPTGRAWAALLGVETVRRFGQKDASGSAGVSYRGERSGGYAQFQAAPDATIVPRVAADGIWNQGLRKGLYVEGALRAADYVPARVYTQSAGLYWWPWAWVELLGRAAATTTEFRHAATVTRPGFLALANVLLRGESLRVTPSFGYYEEPFEAGAPGALGAFKADVYHLGAGLRPWPDLEFKLDAEYEARSAGAFVRRGQAAVSCRF